MIAAEGARTQAINKVANLRDEQQFEKWDDESDIVNAFGRTTAGNKMVDRFAKAFVMGYITTAGEVVNGVTEE